MATIRSITRIKYKESAETGAQGERGAIARVRQWVASTEYLCGDDGEEFLDYVYYNQQYYRCLTSHTSATAINPYVTAGVLWELQSNFNFISSAVMFVGDEDDGWVMDGGVLYHTSGTISLASDGSIVASGGNFEVDADGNLTASNATITGEIHAESGEIGNFAISDSGWLSAAGDGYEMDISAAVLQVSSTDMAVGSTTYNVIVRMQAYASATTSYHNAVYLSSDVEGTSYYNRAVYAAATGDNKANYAVYATASGSDNYNYAVYVAAGLSKFHGVENNVWYISSSGTYYCDTLSAGVDSVNVILVNSSSAVTIYLPTAPNSGRSILLIKAGSGNVTLNGTSKYIYELQNGSSSLTYTSSNKEMTKLVYYGGTWWASHSEN